MIGLMCTKPVYCELLLRGSSGKKTASLNEMSLGDEMFLCNILHQSSAHPLHLQLQLMEH